MRVTNMFCGEINFCHESLILLALSTVSRNLNMLAIYAIVTRYCMSHIAKFTGIDCNEALLACVAHTTIHAEMV